MAATFLPVVASTTTSSDGVSLWPGPWPMAIRAPSALTTGTVKKLAKDVSDIALAKDATSLPTTVSQILTEYVGSLLLPPRSLNEANRVPSVLNEASSAGCGSFIVRSSPLHWRIQ